MFTQPALSGFIIQASIFLLLGCTIETRYHQTHLLGKTQSHRGERGWWEEVIDDWTLLIKMAEVTLIHLGYCKKKEAFQLFLWLAPASNLDLKTAINNHWTRLLEWTTGLTLFALQLIFMAYSKIFLLVNALYRSFLTWPPASLPTSCLFDYVNNNQFNDCQHS